MELSKTDIAKYAQFTSKIENRLIEPHIRNARKYDVQPYLTRGLMDAIIALANGADNELSAFYEDYVEEVWALGAYMRFITEHGYNVTQFGLTKTNDPRGTFTQMESVERATILKARKADLEVAVKMMTDRLKDVNFTFDGTVYPESDSIERTQSTVSAVKRNLRKRPFGYDKNKYNRYDKFLD
jgi:hypothetical protein